MSKKATVIWCFLGISVVAGLYCVAAMFLPHIQNYMWIAFISLPLYFFGGAKLNEMPRYIVCSICGVLWGALCLVCMSSLAIPGLGGAVNMFVWVTVIVCVCCVVHIVILTEDKAKGLFCSCPMVFGGFAAIFSQGPGEIVGVIIALLIGVVLAWFMTYLGGPISKLVDAKKSASK